MVFPFIKEGENRKSSSTHKSHYIDYHGAYHIDEIRHRAKGDWAFYSFNITTRDVGTYKATAEIAADGVSSMLSLALRIQDKPINKMRCVAHWGCFVAANPSAWRSVEAGG